MARYTFEICLNAAKQCETKKEFREKFPYHLQACHRYGWTEEVYEEANLRGRTVWNLEKFRNSAKGCKSLAEFRTAKPSVYTSLARKGLTNELINSMGWKNYSHSDKQIHTYENCLELASKFSTKQEFRLSHPNELAAAQRQGWLSKIEKHLGWKSTVGGFSRKNFVEACQRNNSGFGIFYLLKMSFEDESFFKFGVTSRDVEARYERNNVIYDIEIIMELEVDANFAFDLEKYFKKSTAEFRYTPEISFPGSKLECFLLAGQVQMPTVTFP